jgi:adhesin transport system membrane fusion protein
MSLEQNPPQQELPDSGEHPKGRLERFYQSCWVSVQPTITKCRPIVSKYWDQFEGVAERLFALSDHSSMRTPRIILRVSAAMLLIFFLWALFFKIDQVVHAQGQVIASSQTQIIQAADGGILVSMKVKEGEEVVAGQVIAVLEKERALASFTESQGRVMALRMTVSRLQAEIADKPLVFDASLLKFYPQLVDTQMNLYKQKRKAIDDQLLVLKDNIKLAKQELAMNEPLEKMGDVSKADILRLRRTANEAVSQYASANNKYLQDASAELNKAQEDLNAQEQTLADREQLLDHTDIVAPMAGLVKSIRVNTLGGVVRQGDEILQILPTESDLIVEAKVKPSDMANLKVGLPSNVKLDAYDSSIFGSMIGKVTYISPDSLTEETKVGPSIYYRVKIAIDKKEFKGDMADQIEVRPGMTATIDIKTGNRSVLSFLLKPLSKTFGDAMGER